MAPPSKSADERAELVERWLAHPRSWSPRPSADGRFVHVLSNREGLPQAYTVEHAGGPLRPFWSEPERVGTVVPSPFDARVVVASDRGGNEHWELSLAGEGGSLVRRLTATPDRIHEPGAWRDARRFLYSSNQRDVRFFDVYECDLDGEGGGRMVRQEDALVSVVAAKGPLALLQRANTNLDVDLFLLRGETEHHLNPHSGEQMVFGADLVGRDVYAGTNPDREFTALVRYPESGGTPEVIRDFPGDVERIRSAPDHVRLAGTSNDHGWSELWVYDSGSSEFANLPLAQPGVVDSVAWSRDGTELFYDL
ncbi:MAG: hypothetical protein L3K10_07900, partial [Thermoplasmata archaeon]|nr:hypothetical protein [Thermoplasmata archaeon]